MKAAPTLGTAASKTIPAGGKIRDTATLSGGVSPTGTISFQLYASSDRECSDPIGGPVMTMVDKGDHRYRSPTITESAPGSYQWLASYSGDEHNAGVNAECNDADEQVLVKAKPSLQTIASGPVLAGEQIHDSATLTGGLSPTGTISFQLYAASDRKCATAIGSPVATEVDHGNGRYESPAITEITSSSYQWLASYSGDQDNDAVKAKCNQPAERVVVDTAPLSSLEPAGGASGGLAGQTLISWIAAVTSPG